jgi:hypothetical protein
MLLPYYIQNLGILYIRISKYFQIIMPNIVLLCFYGGKALHRFKNIKKGGRLLVA